MKNQKRLLDSIGEKIGVKNGDLSPFYTLSFEDFVQYSGSGITMFYRSMYPLLTATYPDYNWEPWRFQVTPKSLISDENYVKLILDKTELKLNIKSLFLYH